MPRPDVTTPPSSYKWELLGLFWLANFLNQGDRQIFNAILPRIRDGLGATDVQMGLVATMFTLVFGALVPVAGILGDRLSRKWMVCLSLLVFSAGTLLTGISGGLVSLIVFRSVATGAGESFYIPPALSLLSQYHQRTRALAMSINQTSLYVGIIASSWIAAAIAERYGWRSAFFAFGAGGILLAVALMLRVRNDPANSPAGESVPSLRATAHVLLRKPTVYLLGAAFACMVFVNVGFMTWMPTLLFEQFHLPLTTAAFQAVLIHHLLAFVGVLVGGWWSDRRAIRSRVARLWVCAGGLLGGAPFIVWLGQAQTLTTLYFALGFFGLFRGVYDSNLYAALYEVVPAAYRSAATGLMICFAFCTGAAAPLALGWVKQQGSLSLGLSSLAAFYVAGAVLIGWAAFRHFARDSVAEPVIP